MDIGRELEKSSPGLNAGLYSDAPFPWCADRKLDDFERESLKFLSENTKRPFIRIREEDGRRVIRYATAVTLKQSCVDCHNLPKFNFSQNGNWVISGARGRYPYR